MKSFTEIIAIEVEGLMEKAKQYEAEDRARLEQELRDMDRFQEVAAAALADAQDIAERNGVANADPALFGPKGQLTDEVKAEMESWFKGGVLQVKEYSDRRVAEGLIEEDNAFAYGASIIRAYHAFCQAWLTELCSS